MRYLQIIVDLDGEHDVERNSDLAVYDIREPEKPKLSFAVDDTVYIKPEIYRNRTLKGEVVYLEVLSDDMGKWIADRTQERIAR